MKLPEKMTTGKVKPESAAILLYGPPKVGKSAFASGFPNAVFFATEKGYKALKVYAADVETWEDFKSGVEKIKSKGHKFDTVVIDTVDLLFDRCSAYVCEKLGIEHESEGEWGRGWASVKDEFTDVITNLLQSKCGIIFISHTKGDKITTPLIDITKTIPTLSNQARKILLPLVDIIGCMRYRTKKVDKDTYEEQLIIDFKPSDYVEAGDRTGMLPSILKLKNIPEGTKRTPDIVAKYAKRNYEKFASYFE